ncbi:MAG: thioredoxin [Prevotellaceae bacterium]|jgi:thioredoxin 1|nr:thioredoxin [Prevotellaceae bacterium]
MLHITDSNFENIIASNTVTVIDFSATWCGPCRKVTPIVEELAETYSGQVAIGKVDVDESPNITEMFSIRNVPTILFFKNGELQADKVVGAIDHLSLDAKIKALL